MSVHELESDSQNVETIICDIVARLHADNGHDVPEINGAFRLWDSELDSLDIAVLVVELADLTGVDPLADGAEFHTVAELAAYYRS